MDAILPVDLAFDFAGVTSPAALEARLLNLRARGRTADTLPGRIVEKLPDLLAAPAPTYDYAETAFFLAAEAAENILHASVDWPHKIMETILKHRIQFIGVAREHYLFALREYMFKSDLDTLPNCTGISPAGYGDNTIPRYCVESNVANARRVLRDAGVRFQRTLALIKPDDTPDRRVTQHELRFWIAGADLPAAQRIPVEICWRNGHLDIGPAGDDKLRLVQMAWDMPVYTVPKSAIIPIGQESGAAPAGPAWPVVAEGPRFAVAKDFHAFYDKRDGREYPIECENARFAVRVMLSFARGRKNAKSKTDVETHLREVRVAEHRRDANTMTLLHYFQTRDLGRRMTVPAYGMLIHNVPRHGLYWIEL